jgi:hypothetical protein
MDGLVLLAWGVALVVATIVAFAPPFLTGVVISGAIEYWSRRWWLSVPAGVLSHVGYHTYQVQTALLSHPELGDYRSRLMNGIVYGAIAACLGASCSVFAVRKYRKAKALHERAESASDMPSNSTADTDARTNDARGSP